MADWEVFAKEVTSLCQLHGEAKAHYAKGIHVVRVDEKPGRQALERDGKTLPTQPGNVERREFNDIRHGTQVVTGNLHLATGKRITPTSADTRTEADCVEPIARRIPSDPTAGFVLLCDQLTTHTSESLVRFIAQALGDEQVFGEKGRWGILKSMQSRQAYLSDPHHRIRFVSPPKHCRWLNSIDAWFRILDTHVLNRGNFPSIHDV